MQRPLEGHGMAMLTSTVARIVAFTNARTLIVCYCKPLVFDLVKKHSIRC